MTTSVVPLRPGAGVASAARCSFERAMSVRAPGPRARAIPGGRSAGPFPLKADMPFEYRIRPAGIFDIEGPDGESFLQGQLTQDVHALRPGEARPAAGLNPKGKLLYLARAVGTGGGIRLVVPAASRERVFQHLSKYAVFQRVTVTDRSAEIVRMGVYGSAPLPAPEPSGSMRIAGEGEFTGEILFPLHALEAFEGALGSAGARRIDDEQGEVRRVEAGRPRFGQEAEEGSFLDELSMEEAISRTKGCYVGQEIVARIRTYGRVNRRLVGFRFPDGPIPAGERLKAIEEVEAGKIEQGRVTSSVRSPRFGAIGLGFAFREVAPGQRLVSVTDPRRAAVVCPPRFS